MSQTCSAESGGYSLIKRRAAEFFAGIGLVRMALERSGWEVAFANDISPTKFEMYRENFGEKDFAVADIRTLRGDMLPDVTLATASFPCIDLSLAGNRKGLNGKHSSAYWEFYRIIEEMGPRRPKLILIENVVGLLSSNRGQDLRSILASLATLGYGYDLLIVNAAHFAPQSRPRLFVIASIWTHERNISKLPIHEARPRQILEFIHSNRNLRWSHIPIPPFPWRKEELADVVECEDFSSSVWWDASRQNHLYRQMSEPHKRRLQELTSSRNFRFATVYKRVRLTGCMAELRTDGVAGCLRTPVGGSSKQFLIQAGRGNWKVRNLTAREYARLQGVPDSYVINCKYNQALHGFGDAVCVPAVEWIIRYCVNSMIP